MRRFSALNNPHGQDRLRAGNFPSRSEREHQDVMAKTSVRALGLILIPLLLLVGFFLLILDPELRSEIAGPRPVAMQAAYRIAANAWSRPWLSSAVQKLLEMGPAQRQLLGLLQTAIAGRPSVRSSHRAEEDGFFRLIFPHTANGTGGGLSIRSSVRIVAISGINTRSTIILRRQNGGDFVMSTNLGRDSRFDFELGPGQALHLESDGSGPVTVGWIEVVSDVPLAGSGTFAIFRSSGEFLSK